jgi:hypothetical protein
VGKLKRRGMAALDSAIRYAKWALMEGDISTIISNLQNYKSSLTVMLALTECWYPARYLERRNRSVELIYLLLGYCYLRLVLRDYYRREYAYSSDCIWPVRHYFCIYRV